MSDPELPAFLKRDKVQIREDRFYCMELFTTTELAHIAPEVLLTKVSERASAHMDRAGAIRPYLYSCDQLERGLYGLRCEEYAG